MEKKVGADGYRTSHRRNPLGDATAAANVMKPRSKDPEVKLDDLVPRNESLLGNGSLNVQHTIVSPKNKRISDMSSEVLFENKRNSAISTTSTNASGTARKRKTHIGPWQLGSTVGKGGTARVRKVRHAVTGQTGVAKIIPIAVAEKSRAMSLANLVHSAEQGDPTLQFDKAIPLGLERENAIMKLLQHPNIVRLYDVWENRNEIYLIMEYVQGGELFDYVACHTRLPEDVTVYLFRQIIWALKYCHGLNIHHRDLKPENILLDYDQMTVKLVDFGMAALQPIGNFLTTPCGSPHYAAPELLQNKPYDGSQADVWSAGVVLFVMLTGYPPFNFPTDTRNIIPEDQKLKYLFQAISRADYKMPCALSREAQDLIRRVFVPNPRKRITIDEMWEHPFLHKFDAAWGAHSFGSLNSLSDLASAEEHWRPLKVKTIDREIFRALRTLWHSESDTVLTQKLCSKEFNQEKFFYHSMLRYREDNESFQSNPDDLGYSASDYQHSKSTASPPPLPTDVAARSSGRRSEKSEFSITGNEHIQSKHSYYDLAVSEASYDPFRASRSPMPNVDDEYLNVTLHRLDSKGSRRPASRNSRGNSLRIEVLRQHSRRSSRLSSKHSNASNSIRKGPNTGKRSSRSSSSKNSMASSHLLNGSPLPIMRPSEVHRRGVQFPHLRKSSIGSALVSVVEAEALSRTPDRRTRALQRLSLGSSSHSIPRMTSSPPPSLPDMFIRSRKGGAVLPTPKTRKARDNLDHEARKVSVELGKACDEAFFRPSVGSSIRSSITEQPTTCDTPPSSVSLRSPNGLPKDPFYVSDSIRDRPLPPTPVGTTRSTLLPSETPSTYTARALAEMRDRLAVKYARDGAGNQKYFNDVLRQLDKLMLPNEGDEKGSESRRIVSAPPNYHNLAGSEDLKGLHVIPEEDRIGEPEATGRGERSSRWRMGDPQGRKGRQNNCLLDRTIRVVAPSPPPSPTPKPWPPLIIRKTSNSSKGSGKAVGHSQSTTNPGDHEANHNQKDEQMANYHGPHGGDDLDAGICRIRNAVANNNGVSTMPNLSDDNDGTELTPMQLNQYDPDRIDIAPPRWGFQPPHVPNRVASPSVSITTEAFQTPEEAREADAQKLGAQFVRANKLGFLDDRATMREAREAKRDAPQKFSFKKLFGKKTPKAEGQGDATIDTKKNYNMGGTADAKKPKKENTNNMGGNAQTGYMQVLKNHDEQKDCAKDMDVDFLGRFAMWMRSHLFTPLLKPVFYVIAIDMPRRETYTLCQNKCNVILGIKIDRAINSHFTLYCSVDASQIDGMNKDVSFVLEVFPISKRNVPMDKSLIRITQTGGSAYSMRQIAREIHQQFFYVKAVVKDQHEAEMMKAALLQGLGGVMPYVD